MNEVCMLLGLIICDPEGKARGKAMPLQAWTGPPRGLAPRISRQSAYDGGKVVSPTHQPH